MTTREIIISFFEFQSKLLKTCIAVILQSGKMKIYQKTRFHYICTIKIIQEQWVQIRQALQLVNNKYILICDELQTGKTQILYFTKEQIEEQLVQYQQKIFGIQKEQVLLYPQKFKTKELNHYLHKSSFGTWRKNNNIVVFKQSNNLLIYLEQDDVLLNVFSLLQDSDNINKLLGENYQILDFQLSSDNYLVVLTQNMLLIIQLQVYNSRQVQTTLVYNQQITAKQKTKSNQVYLNDLSDEILDLLIINSGIHYLCYQVNMKNNQMVNKLWQINCAKDVTSVSIYISKDYAVFPSGILYYHLLYQNQSKIFIQRYQYAILSAYKQYFQINSCNFKLVYAKTMKYEPYSVYNPAFKLVGQNIIHFEREDEYDIDEDTYYYNSPVYPKRSVEQIPLLIEKMSNTK